MSFEQFKQDAMRTENRIACVKGDPIKMRGAFMMAIAVATLADIMKKNIFYGRPIDPQKVWRTISALEQGVEHFEGHMDVPAVEYGIDPRILHGVLGKFTEAGEMMEAVWNSMLSGKPIDMVNLGEEMGDDQWYDAILFDACGFDIDKIRDTVIAKLKARYPESFTNEAANGRDLAVERGILEAGIGA